MMIENVTFVIAHEYLEKEALTLLLQTSKVLKMRSVIMQAFRDHFINRGYYEVSHCVLLILFLSEECGTCMNPENIWFCIALL